MTIPRYCAKPWCAETGSYRLLGVDCETFSLFVIWMELLRWLEIGHHGNIDTRESSKRYKSGLLPQEPPLFSIDYHTAV